MTAARSRTSYWRAGEEPVFSTRPHWIILVRPAITLVVALLVLTVIAIAHVVTLRFLGPFARNVWLQLGILVLTLIGVLRSLSSFGNLIVFYQFSRYTVTTQRVLTRSGLFDRSEVDVPLARIESTAFYQTLVGSWLNYGRVSLRGVGGSIEDYGTVCAPVAFKDAIEQLVSGAARGATVLSTPPAASSGRALADHASSLASGKE
jgi:uncharacterized membrane protein YdbT with pleckstrin-like domain